jgi:hypothetical protein
MESRFNHITFGFDTKLNHHLSQKRKLNEDVNLIT